MAAPTNEPTKKSRVLAIAPGVAIIRATDPRSGIVSNDQVLVCATALDQPTAKLSTIVGLDGGRILIEHHTAPHKRGRQLQHQRTMPRKYLCER